AGAAARANILANVQFAAGASSAVDALRPFFLPHPARLATKLRTPRPFACRGLFCVAFGFRSNAVPNVVVVGSQWGDEGKGKIVDWLSEQADVVVRFQGGHNAGHTLVINGQTYKLSLLPSGVVRPGKLAIIGNGVVLDPHALVTEIDRLIGQGVDISP